MRKSSLLILMLLVLCMLCACAPRLGNTNSTDLANPSQETVPLQDASGLPEPCECVDIYNDGKISLRMIYGMNYETGKKTLILRWENTGDESVTCVLADPVINGNIVGDEYEESLEAGDIIISRMDVWQKSMYYTGDTVIHSVSGKVQLCEKHGADPYAEAEFEAAFEKEGRGFLWDRLINAEIPPQVLLDDDRCRLTLLCFGYDLTTSRRLNDFSGILFVENKTDKELPVFVNGITVNDRMLNRLNTMSETVPAGGAVFGSFMCFDEDFEEQRVNGVRSVSLLIMTDKEEITGTSINQKGGRWYPLKVENPDTTPEPPVEEGTVMMDMNGVRIRLLDPVPLVEDYYEDSIRYVWNMYAENETDYTIEIGLEDATEDGKSFDEWSFGAPDFRFCIAPGSSQFFKMYTEKLSQGVACPEISGVFRVYEYGKSRILFDSERVTFPTDSVDDP